MTETRANKFVGKLVKLTFKNTWFNEATQSWVEEETEYVGYLDKCSCKGQEKYFVLDEMNGNFLPTDNACWRANSIKSIKEVSL